MPLIEDMRAYGRRWLLDDRAAGTKRGRDTVSAAA